MNKTNRQDPVLDFSGSLRGLLSEIEGFGSPESALVGTALALGAERVKPLSEHETSLVRSLRSGGIVGRSLLSRLRDQISAGLDPLGEAFCAIRSADLRRERGATYTPRNIVGAMIDWAAARRKPERIVDPGTGSGRFLLAAGRVFNKSQLIGVDSDPLAALIARANLAACGFESRSQIFVEDFRRFDQVFGGRTLFIGNPPYVRHHRIETKWKDWLFRESQERGHKASKLAGLHVHFFLATARSARRGDYGVFVTAAEWLDVNYGSLVRSLLLGELGAESITVIEPAALPFQDALTTAVITGFEVGTQPKSVFFRRVGDVGRLRGLQRGRRISRHCLMTERKWSHLTSPGDGRREGFVELGELCRVHRGQVTGSNLVWIAGAHSTGLPDSVLYPTITRAKELISAGDVLDDLSNLRRVIDLPVDLEDLRPDERTAVESFLRRARALGADKGYIASHRRAWWAVELKPPAPIISTYMARRPPAFVLNRAGARHINIAHGLYPRIQLNARAQLALVRFLQTNVSMQAGRTYGGGLTKFEPREMERLFVPGPALLGSGAMQ